MGGRAKSIIGVSFRFSLLAGCVAAPAMAWAGSFTPPTSGPYRLAFVTADGISASSSDIAGYNSFVTDEAAQNAALPTTSWTAIVSTQATDAITNTACSISGCASDPIYLVDGTELATSLANFFADNLLTSNAITVDQNGAPFGGTYVWTGSNADGTAASGYELGSTYPVFGNPLDGNGLNFSNYYNNDNLFSLYALSAPITSTSVPEPGSAGLLVIGAVALAASRRRRGTTTV